MTELNRSLGFWGATGIGIGAIIGTGIFVLIGVASGIAGPAVILSFIIAGFVALLSGFLLPNCLHSSMKPGEAISTRQKHSGNFRVL